MRVWVRPVRKGAGTVKDANHYRKLGKDIGFAGIPLDEAYREGHHIGVELRKIKVGYALYEKDSTDQPG